MKAKTSDLEGRLYVFLFRNTVNLTRPTSPPGGLNFNNIFGI